ncbi:MAG: HupE/UreJ family protein [Phycisphaerae bacterium]
MFGRYPAKIATIGVGAVLGLAVPALAHTGPTPIAGGLLSGIAHPLSGLDHLLVMLGVGLWAAQLGGRAIWLLPATFVATMLIGAGLALNGVPLPAVEAGIAASVVAIGLLIALARRLPAAVNLALVALFAVFHGHAHGHELAIGASWLEYLSGFALTTTGLHAVGIALGVSIMRGWANTPVRAAGAAMATLGVGMLVTG